MTSRRQFMQRAAAAATVGVAGIPAPVVAAADLLVAPVVAWGVGIEDRGHEIVFAENEAKAIAEHAWSHGYERCEAGEAAGGHCGEEDCDLCSEFSSIEATRHKSLDHFAGRKGEITHVDLHRVGWAVPCAWCNECSAYVCGHIDYPDPWDAQIVDGEVLCDECARVHDGMMTAAFGPLLLDAGVA